MAQREDLEEQARREAEELLERLVQRSEDVDFRQGTYLLASLAAELGGHVQRRCWELARANDPTWEMAASEAETLINAAWRCMATIAGQSEFEDRQRQRRQEFRERDARDSERSGEDEGER